MGQCASNKAKGTLTVKNILSHKKSKKNKMDKHQTHKASKTEEDKMTDNGRKNQKCTKGVAMSFGFKRRSTPMASHTSTIAWDTGTSCKDSNGNKNETTIPQPKQNNPADRAPHKMAPSQKPPISITPRTTRFQNIPHQAQEEATKAPEHKVSSQFGNFNSRSGSRRTSPSPEAEQPTNRSITRNITIVTRRQMSEKEEVLRDGNDNRSNIVDDSMKGATALQPRKFTFQTTRLPQPEAIRVIETKTAKTIANNNKRSERIWRQYEESSLKIGPSGSDSGVCSNASTASGDNKPVLREKIPEQPHSKRYSLLESSDTFSEACTPPPLPELPSSYKADELTLNSNKDRENQIIKEDLANNKKKFFKSGGNFLKNRGRHLLDSPQSSSDQEWGNAGEAMADELSLILSPKNKADVTKELRGSKSPSSVASTLIHDLLDPCASLEMIDSLKGSMHLSFNEDQNNFTTSTMNNKIVLLDDEVLSPVESLLSSEKSEIDDQVNEEPESDHSKDLNEKLTPSCPGSPSNATYSLSDDKDDFLIDDEIADQPELVFEEGGNDRGHAYNLPDGKEKLVKDAKTLTHRLSSVNYSDLSPLPLRKKRQFLESTNQCSYDSLSPCDSIGSDDLMMDFDVSQTNEVDEWDRKNSCLSLENSSKSNFMFDEKSTHKSLLRCTLAPRHLMTNSTLSNVTLSPNAVRRRINSMSASPERVRSPRRHIFNPMGFQSMAYDPMSESLTLTRANHSAVQQDIISIKTMLLTLKRVLNESESCLMRNINDASDSEANNNMNEFKLELSDLRRQVIFLQGQLEDKEKTVTDLQKQVDELAIQNTHLHLQGLDSTEDIPALVTDDQYNKSNAATQTERSRPLSTFSLTTTPIEDNSIIRFMIK